MLEQSEISESFVLSFRVGITLIDEPDGNILLRSDDAEIRFEQPVSYFRSILWTLFSEGAREGELLDSVSMYGSIADLAKLAYHVRRLAQNGMLSHTIVWCGNRLATLVPLASSYQDMVDEPAPKARYVVSRFAYVHKEGEELVLESPLSAARVVLYDGRLMGLLNTLAKACSLEELSSASPFAHSITVLFVRMLLRCRVLSAVDDNGNVEQESPTLAQWEFHDLLFHTRSRLGRHLNPYGATFRFRGKINPLPAVNTSPSGDVVPLYRPDIRALRENDVPFTQVLEGRRSIRKYGERPITVDELGEFFYRTARLRAISEASPQGYERSDRPYPSGGACYELELYVVANACERLVPGLYHYCPKRHQLSKIAAKTRELETLLNMAYYAADEQGVPQVLIILTARFQRVSWKYNAMAYALVLKDVGVLYQTMYLVATAMGLAPCALGGGDSDLFAAVAGTNYYAETSVGEFILGSKAS